MNWNKVVRRALSSTIRVDSGRGTGRRFWMPRGRGAAQAIAFLLGLLLAAPATAHLTQVSGDIAGTWHVEPDHSPRAGEPAQVWIALTQRGGQIVPLDQCDCQLAVYQGSESAPILKPELQPIAAENFKGIPGAEVVFPQVGQYQLRLTGRPKAAASFQPFELNYTVTVATGSSPAAQQPAPQNQTAASPQAQTAPPDNPIADTEAPADSGVFTKVLVGLGAIVLILGAVAVVLRQQKVRKL